MGFTGLACWSDSPTSAVEIVQKNITKNHLGHVLSRWHVQIRSYRPGAFDAKQQLHGMQQQMGPRSMVTVTMNDALFVLIEDPTVPLSDPHTPGSPDVPLAAGDREQPQQQFINPILVADPHEIKHRRTSFVVIRPPESLDLLLNQLQAKWIPTRQTGGGISSKGQGLAGGPHVTIEGLVFSIGTDWIIRAGNIMLAGGATRGMLLEAEYLPLPVPPQPIVTMEETATILSNMLTSLLPTNFGAKILVFPITDALWEDVLYGTDDREEQQWTGLAEADEGGDDGIYITAKDAIPKPRKGDWTGDFRDQRSAFLIIGAMKSEGMV